MKVWAVISGDTGCDEPGYMAMGITKSKLHRQLEMKGVQACE